MKSLSILFVVSILSLFIIGCDCEIEPPANYNVNEDSTWIKVANGTVEKVTYHRDPFCDKRPVCKKDCQERGHGSYYEIELTDGRKYSLGLLLRPGTLVTGHNGSLYKYDKGLSDSDSCFIWEKENIELEVKDKKYVSENFIEKPEEIKIDYTNLALKHEWKVASRETPDFNKPVMLELDNGLLTIGYYTRTKEWKTHLDKDKLSGGFSLTNVRRWKEVDLD